MGSSSSRPRSPRAKRNLLSVFICGGSTSNAPIEMEDDPAELLMNSAQQHNPVSDKFRRPKKESGVAPGTDSLYGNPNTEHASISESNSEATVDSFCQDSSGSVVTNNHGEGLSRNKEIISPCQLGVGRRSRDRASTSYEDQSLSGPVSANRRTNLEVASGTENIMDGDVSSHKHSRVAQSSISVGLSVENHASELSSMHDSDSGSTSILSDSPINFDFQRNENLQNETPSGIGFIVSDREQERRRDETVLHLDMVSISSNIMSNSNTDIGNREARRNSRRLFWDTVSRRNSRRPSDSRTLVLASDDLESRDRWLLDINGDLFDDGARGGTGFLGSRTQIINERRWNSRSEIWERLCGGRDGSDRRTTICPSGMHPSDACTCDSISMAEESGTRARIARIVMLTEALFEVLDGIHRQPVSRSLSMVSLPAPESVVDSLPVKIHRRTTKTGDDAEQCYICLVDYEEGDKIRVLPCHHEYHMPCVDKWLKEIHGVCPLCRGDVRDGFSEAAVSNPEIPSS